MSTTKLRTKFNRKLAHHSMGSNYPNFQLPYNRCRIRHHHLTKLSSTNHGAERHSYGFKKVTHNQPQDTLWMMNGDKAKKRRRQGLMHSVPLQPRMKLYIASDHEKQLEELIFGKNIVSDATILDTSSIQPQSSVRIKIPRLHFEDIYRRKLMVECKRLFGTMKMTKVAVLI